jgi:sugar (pentulose or hexulose) kinase
MRIIGCDIGTSSMKIGVYEAKDRGLRELRVWSKAYAIRTYNDGLYSDIEQEKWQAAFAEGISALGETATTAEVIALSGTTPGLTAIADDGKALYPAILMLDQRSRTQAANIIEAIGIDRLLAETGNMPVAGGCSLASILWLRDNEPEVFERARWFGHSNTYFAGWLTGSYCIDPSSASLTALYNTTRNDLTWNEEISGAFGISADRLPRLIRSNESCGQVTAERARELGFAGRPHVVIGGNDAVLAAWSVGIREPGEIINVNGTAEITLVCLPQCYGSTAYNVRAHVLPDRWLTLYVMNAGGKAYEWFHSLFCRELSADEFYGRFVPEALDSWVDRENAVEYVPYLMGSRYSLENLKAGFVNLTPETSREQLLAAMVRSLCRYQREHLKEIALRVPLADAITLTGGASNESRIRAKQRWMRGGDYVYQEQSSMRGAALLGLDYLQRS